MLWGLRGNGKPVQEMKTSTELKKEIYFCNCRNGRVDSEQPIWFFVHNIMSDGVWRHSLWISWLASFCDWGYVGRAEQIRLCFAEVKSEVTEPVNAPGDSKAADPGSAPDNIEQVWLMIDTMSFILRKFRRLRQDSILQAKLAEKAAMEAQEKIDSQALPIRAYLDQTVVPLLLQGLSDLVKARY